jgi:hypothetical protein
MSDRKWTHQTAVKISNYLRDNVGIIASPTVVRRLILDLKYSLKSNRKRLSSGSSPDRDDQFQIIQFLKKEFTREGNPIVSIDAKKKELIGNYKNAGRSWRRTFRDVKDHDFRSEAQGIATPYGIFDIQCNEGFVVVGQSSDTPEFAVNSLVKWWQNRGCSLYSKTNRLLILADSGGSNGVRNNMWKKFLQERFVDQFGISVTVAHYPSGASKWNPIEHRLFSEISKNWAGHPLETFECTIRFIRSTSTATGLKVDAVLDHQEYQTGIKASKKEMENLSINKDFSVGKLVYTIEPSQYSHRQSLEDVSVDSISNLICRQAQVCSY